MSLPTVFDRYFAKTYPTQGLRNLLRNVVEGIAVIGKEDADYWLGMANPRRVLVALHMLFTSPNQVRSSG